MSFFGLQLSMDWVSGPYWEGRLLIFGHDEWLYLGFVRSQEGSSAIMILVYLMDCRGVQ